MASSLADILQDPNYVNANDATKKAIFDKFSAQDTNYTGANEATQKAIRVKFGVEPPAAAAPGEGMPTGPRNAGLFERLAPATTRPTAADIMRARQEEEVGAPGISPGVNPRAVAYPMMEMGGMTVGGALGGIPGAGAGYAAAKAAERPLAEYTSVPQALKLTAQDVGTGMLYDVGGKLATKAVGAVAMPLAKGIVKGVNKLRGVATTTAQTVEELKAAETAAWDATKQSTATFADPVPLKNSVDELLQPSGYNYVNDPDAFPAVKQAVNQLDEAYAAAAEGKPIDIHKFRAIRTRLQDIENSAAKSREKGLAGAIKNKLDEYVSAYGGEDAATWENARDISNQLFRSRDIQAKLENAGSKEIRERFKDLMDSNAIRAYTPEQQQLIQQIANGNLTEKGLELVSNLAPQNVNWRNIAGMLGIGAITHTGGPLAGLAAYGTGAASRATANALARSRVNALDELIRGGQFVPPLDLSFLQPATSSALMYGTQPSQNALAR